MMVGVTVENLSLGHPGTGRSRQYDPSKAKAQENTAFVVLLAGGNCEASGLSHDAFALGGTHVTWASRTVRIHTFCYQLQQTNMHPRNGSAITPVPSPSIPSANPAP
eukprot:74474-Rhodomonas_salina.1